METKMAAEKLLKEYMKAIKELEYLNNLDSKTETQKVILKNTIGFYISEIVKLLKEEGWTQFIISKNKVHTLYDDMQGVIQNISEEEVESYISARKVRI